MKNQSLKSSLKITSFLFLASIILLSLRPIPQATTSNCEVVSGTVVDIYESGTKDVSIKLKGNVTIIK